jgi:hypothetical protein
MIDPETRPSVGKDVHQDPAGKGPPPAPDNMRPSSNSAPATGPNTDPGYAGQATMNRQNPDQQQNRGERPHVEFEQDEKVRKAEIKQAVQEDAERQDADGGVGGGHGG